MVVIVNGTLSPVFTFTACAVLSIAIDALDALYRQYPDRSIKTAQGWPIDYSYWSGSYVSKFSSEAPIDFY
ncbi:hypothetical protein JVW21_20705, partial [Vibrio cholerae O1]|nr:hypothetical protein [Vibrio cholerae O1]